MSKKAYGFTIVELLIVIVVIGILAAITVVAYNGIQQRARVATAKTDLRNIATQMEMYKTDNGTYPVATVNRPGGYPEIAAVLRNTGLYDITRSKLDGSPEEKAFLFCGTATDTYTVVAVRPVLAPVTGEEAAGQTLYFVTPKGVGEAEYVWDTSIVNANPTGVNICKSVDASYNITFGNVWSHNAPTASAQ